MAGGSMAWVRQKFVYAAAVMLAITASQFPEFAQQYRQRLGGAIEELGRVVSEFDRDAVNSGLSRKQALAVHRQSTVPLFQARGRSMQASIDRYENLLRQRRDFSESSTLAQPLVLAHSDSATLAGAWHEFSPAVPTTTDGLVWAVLGFLLGGAVAHLAAGLLRMGWRGSVLAIRRKPAALGR
jgi:hypothetical protein